MKIVIFTGDETRHEFFRKRVALDERIEVLASYCEGTEKSLSSRVAQNPNASSLEQMHVEARAQSENDFFSDLNGLMQDFSNPVKIPKGSINEDSVVEQISKLEADLLVCYGSSLIKSSLLKNYKGRFLNVHLGLSPYYRGSGTNVWPLINKEPDMVGATFMHIDEGIDTGRIIHQIRADISLGDSPHSIGNRLIKKMTDTYCEIIINFNNLSDEQQPDGEGRLYLRKDFDSEACDQLYKNFGDGMIYNYITSIDKKDLPYIVFNKGLKD